MINVRILTEWRANRIFKSLVDNVLYYLSIIFLIGSIIVYIRKPDVFDWTSLFGTDGLTLFGLVFTLITLASMKIPLFRKIISTILLKTNLLKIRYEISTVATHESGDKKIEYLLDSFITALKSARLFDNYDYEVFNKEITLIRIFVPSMNAHLTIKQLPPSVDYFDDDDDYEIGFHPKRHVWKLELSGKENYMQFDKNIKLLLNSYYESLQLNHFKFYKFNLVLTKKNTEYNLIDKGILLDKQKYTVSNSMIEIQSSENTTIIIDQNTGISISSKTKGEFANSIDILKNILVS